MAALQSLHAVETLYNWDVAVILVIVNKNNVIQKLDAKYVPRPDDFIILRDLVRPDVYYLGFLPISKAVIKLTKSRGQYHEDRSGKILATSGYLGMILDAKPVRKVWRPDLFERYSHILQRIQDEIVTPFNVLDKERIRKAKEEERNQVID